MSVLADPCTECRFDGSQYTKHDLERSFAALGLRAEWALDGAALHVRDDGRVRAHLEAIRAVDGADIRAAVHAGQHELAALGRTVHALGAGAPSQHGAVAGLFASGGGVPKLPIDEAVIGYRGVDGDRQQTRRHHGRVWQALCLWSADVVDRLQREGHPIAPGRAGENVSVAGIDWTTLRPGVRLALGATVLAEVSAYAAPCKQNQAWFLDGDFGRMGHDREPGIGRIYASVLRDGVLRTGDPVIVEP